MNEQTIKRLVEHVRNMENVTSDEDMATAMNEIAGLAKELETERIRNIAKTVLDVLSGYEMGIEVRTSKINIRFRKLEE